jgi:long-chain acyl-CoA synthetase
MSRTLGELILNTSARFGDDVAFQVRRGFRLERVTFRQAGERARETAGWLTARGLAPGDRVVVWSSNMPEYAMPYFGARLAGVVVVPIDVRIEKDDWGPAG